jgi:hypothetical protein
MEVEVEWPLRAVVTSPGPANENEQDTPTPRAQPDCAQPIQWSVGGAAQQR